jgi:hypothetical protein
MSSDPGDGPRIIPFGPAEHTLLLEWGELTGQVDNPVHDGGWLFYRCDAANLDPGAPGFTYELFGRQVPGPQAFPPILKIEQGAETVYYAAWRVRIYLGHPEPLDAPVLDAPFLERTSHRSRTYRHSFGGWTGQEPPTRRQVLAVYAGAPALGATLRREKPGPKPGTVAKYKTRAEWHQAIRDKVLTKETRDSADDTTFGIWLGISSRLIYDLMPEWGPSGFPKLRAGDFGDCNCNSCRAN